MSKVHRRSADTSSVREVFTVPYHPLLTDVAQICARLLDTGGKGLLTLTDPNTRVVELLVGLVSALGVADLGLEVLELVDDEVLLHGNISIRISHTGRRKRTLIPARYANWVSL